MTRAARRRVRQHGPETDHAVPEAERTDLLAQANRLARNARQQGYECLVDLGDERNRYKPRLAIEIWDKSERST